MPRRYAGLGPPCLYRIPSARQLANCCYVASSTLPCIITAFLVSFASLSAGRCLAAYTSYFLRAAINLRDLLNPHLCLQRRHVPVPRCAKRPDVASYAIDRLFFIPTPSTPYCTLKVSKYDSPWQPPAAHSDKCPRPQTSSGAQAGLNAFISTYLEGTVEGSHPMVWSLALCPDGAKQVPVVYSAELGVVFLAKGPPIRVLRESTTFSWSQSSCMYRLMRIQHAQVHLAISVVMSGVLATPPPPPGR